MLRTQDCFPVPALGAREELNKHSAVSTQPSAKPKPKTLHSELAGWNRAREEPYEARMRPRTRTGRKLPLAELEALPCALLSVLLALFTPGVAADHSLGLELFAQFDIELHQSASNAKLHGIGLAIHAAARHIRDHVKR